MYKSTKREKVKEDKRGDNYNSIVRENVAEKKLQHEGIKWYIQQMLSYKVAWIRACKP